MSKSFCLCLHLSSLHLSFCDLFGRSVSCLCVFLVALLLFSAFYSVHLVIDLATGQTGVVNVAQNQNQVAAQAGLFSSCCYFHEICRDEKGVRGGRGAGGGGSYASCVFSRQLALSFLSRHAISMPACHLKSLFFLLRVRRIASIGEGLPIHLSSCRGGGQCHRLRASHGTVLLLVDVVCLYILCWIVCGSRGTTAAKRTGELRENRLFYAVVLSLFVFCCTVSCCVVLLSRLCFVFVACLCGHCLPSSMD